DIHAAIVLSLHSLTQSHTNVIDLSHSFAVDDEFNLFARNISANAEVMNRKFVLSIGWEGMTNEHSAAGTQRKTFDVTCLPHIARRNIAGFRWSLPVANRHAGDPRCRRRIGFQ